MRLFAAVLLALFALGQQSNPPAPTPGKVNQEKQNASSNKDNETAPVQQPSGAPSMDVQIITGARDNPSDKQNGKSSTDGWLTAFTGALVVVAVLQFIAMYRQADYMRRGLRIAIRSARATRAAARAASVNAEALMNAERPWLVPKITRIVRGVENLRSKDEPRTFHNVTYFSFWIRNVGRTPAQIVAVRGDPRLSYKGIDGGFTDPPDYGLPVQFRQIRLLAPGEKWRTDDDLNIWPLLHLDGTVEKDIKSHKVHYIFKGVILYRDPFNPEEIHETRFCYTYLEGIDDWHVSGPPDHTKYT